MQDTQNEMEGKENAMAYAVLTIGWINDKALFEFCNLEDVISKNLKYFKSNTLLKIFKKGEKLRIKYNKKYMTTFSNGIYDIANFNIIYDEIFDNIWKELKTAFEKFFYRRTDIVEAKSLLASLEYVYTTLDLCNKYNESVKDVMISANLKSYICDYLKLDKIQSIVMEMIEFVVRVKDVPEINVSKDKRIVNAANDIIAKYTDYENYMKAHDYMIEEESGKTS